MSTEKAIKTLREALNSERTRAEILVVVVAILMVVLFVMDAYRLRSNSSVRRVLSVLEPVKYPLVIYTIGLIQNLSYGGDTDEEYLISDFFAIWGVLLYVLESGTEYITTYGIDQTTMWRIQLKDLLMTFFAGSLNIGLANKLIQSYIWVLWSLAPITIFYKIVCFEAARRSYSHGQNSKLLVKYMKTECLQNPAAQSNPTTMIGYRYIVRGENTQQIVAPPPRYQVDIDIQNEEKFITLESVWNCNHRLLKFLDSEMILRDVCLSYALHKLLRCEMVDLFLPNECRYKTQKLLFQGVLMGPNRNKRIFRILEMEIAFLNDYSYTRLPIGVWYGYPLIKLVTFLVTLLISGLLAYNVHKPNIGEDDFENTIKVHIIYRIITYVLLVFIVLKEMWEMSLYIFSDWTKIVIICQYVEGLWLLRNSLMEHIIRWFCRLNLVMRWHNKMSQYNFLESFNYKPWLKKTLHYVTLHMVEKPIEGGKVGKTIKISDEVKNSIAEALDLITTNGYDLRNGMPCLYIRRVEDYNWACNQELSCSELILVWHIATSMCEIKQSKGHERLEGQTRDNYIVARSISRYCAYLLIHVPELLPDHEVVSELIFKGTVSNARTILSDCNSLNTVLEKLREVGGRFGQHGFDNATIVEKGAILGKALLEDWKMNKKAPWEMLAGFWVDLLLYMAPSKMTEDHRSHLIEGGELITLLWALFTNCGVFGRTAQDQQVPANNRPGTTDVERGV